MPLGWTQQKYLQQDQASREWMKKGSRDADPTNKNAKDLLALFEQWDTAAPQPKTGGPPPPTPFDKVLPPKPAPPPGGDIGKPAPTIEYPASPAAPPTPTAVPPSPAAAGSVGPAAVTGLAGGTGSPTAAPAGPFGGGGGGEAQASMAGLQLAAPSILRGGLGQRNPPPLYNALAGLRRIY